MKKIHFYHSKKFLGIFISVLISVIIFTVIIDLTELLRRLSDKEVSFFTVFKLALLKQPTLISEIFPFIILLSSIIFFHKLSNNMVINVLNSAGVSLKTIFIAPIIIIILIYAMELTIFNKILKKVNLQYKVSLAQILQPNDVYNNKKYDQYKKELWIQQKNQDYSYIINAMQVIISEEQVILKDVKIFFLQNYQLPAYVIKKHDLQILNDQKLLVEYLHAKKAVLQSAILSLHNVTIAQLQNKHFINNMTLAHNLDKKFLSNYLMQHNKSYYSLKELYQQSKLLKESGINSVKQDAQLAINLAKILCYINLFLLAAFACIYAPRYKKKLLKIIMAILLGFSTYVLLNLTYSLVILGKISIFYGVFLINIFFMILFTYLLIYKKY
jgi:lipopolysaccharide export LptBFGC system permease protein LptF